LCPFWAKEKKKKTNMKTERNFDSEEENKKKD